MFTTLARKSKMKFLLKLRNKYQNRQIFHYFSSKILSKSVFFCFWCLFLISGQSCTLFWIPNLKFKFWTESNDRLTVTGWGKITNSARYTLAQLRRFKVSQRRLQKLKLPLVSDQTCENLEIYKGAINTSIQLCAGGDRNKDSCGGDSGGPLTYKSSTGTLNSILKLLFSNFFFFVFKYLDRYFFFWLKQKQSLAKLLPWD